MDPGGNIIAGVGIVPVSPQNYVIPHAFSLAESCSNNIVEYNALLIGMQLAEEIDVKHLEAYNDSKLIVNQVHGEYKVRHEDLKPYHNTTINMAKKFKSFYINYIPRQQNAHADAMTSIAASLAFPAGAMEKVLVYIHELYCPKFTIKDNQTPEGGLQVKEVLETSRGLELRDCNSHSSTMSYMAYYPMIPGR